MTDDDTSRESFAQFVSQAQKQDQQAGLDGVYAEELVDGGDVLGSFPPLPPISSPPSARKRASSRLGSISQTFTLRRGSASRRQSSVSSGSSTDDQRADLVGFVQDVNSSQTKLEFLVNREERMKKLVEYEQSRQDMAEKMGTHCVQHARRFEHQLREGINELTGLTKFLKARGEAEVAYAKAIKDAYSSQSRLSDKVKKEFGAVDLNHLAARHTEFGTLLLDNLASDGMKVLDEYTSFHNETRPLLASHHAELIKSERSVRDSHASLVKGFNQIIRSMRTAAESKVVTSSSSLPNHYDLSSDPWMLEQSYRRQLVVANRGAEVYVEYLGKVDEQVIQLGQKRATLVMCAQKLFVFEQLRLHSELTSVLESLSSQVKGDQNLLSATRSVADVSSSELLHAPDEEQYEGDDDHAESNDETDIQRRESSQNSKKDSQQFTFMLPVPPVGTNIFEGDLRFVECAMTDSYRKTPNEWTSVHAVLTNDRVLHLFPLNGESEDMIAQVSPLKSMYLGIQDDMKRNKAIQQLNQLGGEQANSKCFEVKIRSSSLLTRLSIFGGEGVEYYTFQAEDELSKMRWETILSNDTIDLGNPLEIAGCVDSFHSDGEESDGDEHDEESDEDGHSAAEHSDDGGSSGEEESEGEMIASSPMDADALNKILLELPEVTQRNSIFAAGANDNLFDDDDDPFEDDDSEDSEYSDDEDEHDGEHDDQP